MIIPKVCVSCGTTELVHPINNVTHTNKITLSDGQVILDIDITRNICEKCLNTEVYRLINFAERAVNSAKESHGVKLNLKQLNKKF